MARYLFTVTEMTPEDDRIHAAAEGFQKAIQAMGATEVTIMYAYNKDGVAHTGGTWDNMLVALGALTLMEHDLLNDKDDEK